MNLRFTAWPEMLSYPFLRNNDFLLYRDMIHPYPPVLTIVLSLIYKFFGYDIYVLKTVSWFVILFSTVILYYVINYVTRRKALSLVITGAYVLLQPFLEGNMLWFDTAIVPPTLLGVYFFLRWANEKQDSLLVWSSLFLSIAALIKQTAALFIVFLAIYLLFKRSGLGKYVKIAVPPLVLVSLLILRLLQEGALQDFLNWTLLYPVGEWGNFPGYVQMSLSKTQIMILTVLVAPILVINIVRRKVFADPPYLILIMSLLLSLIMVYPRFSFFHFQLALAFIFICFAYLLKHWEIKKSALLLFGVVILLVPFVHKPVLVLDWQKETRFYEKGDVDLAGEIADLTDPSDKVFLLGIHSGIYAVSNRLPSKRWTDNFGWYLEIVGVQEEILERWEGSPPKYVIWRTPSQGNWFDLGVYQPQKIVDFIKSDYTFKGDLIEGIELWQRKDL